MKPRFRANEGGEFTDYEAAIALEFRQNLITPAALVVILLPGLIVASSYPPIPAPRVSFAVNGDTTVAHIAFTAHDVGRRDHLVMDVRSFRSTTDLSGVTLGRLTTTGSPSGEARVNDALAINGDARFMAVRVWFAGRHVPICTPRAALGTGCTLVTVARLAVPPGSCRCGRQRMASGTSARVPKAVPGKSPVSAHEHQPTPPNPGASIGKTSTTAALPVAWTRKHGPP